MAFSLSSAAYENPLLEAYCETAQQEAPWMDPCVQLQTVLTCVHPKQTEIVRSTTNSNQKQATLAPTWSPDAAEHAFRLFVKETAQTCCLEISAPAMADASNGVLKCAPKCEMWDGKNWQHRIQGLKH